MKVVQLSTSEQVEYFEFIRKKYHYTEKGNR